MIFVTGEEQYRKAWGKFYLFGLEDYAIKKVNVATRQTKTSAYRFFQADPPPFTVFSIFEKSGDATGATTFSFLLCCTQPGLVGRYSATYGDGYVQGEFSELARGTGNVKAERLMDWWRAKPDGVDLIEYANHCAIYIAKRGVIVLPPLPK